VKWRRYSDLDNFMKCAIEIDICCTLYCGWRKCANLRVFMVVFSIYFKMEAGTLIGWVIIWFYGRMGFPLLWYSFQLLFFGFPTFSAWLTLKRLQYSKYTSCTQNLVSHYIVVYIINTTLVSYESLNFIFQILIIL
jgi:hypothetical protein